MPPVLQALRTLTVRILFGLALLRKMSLTIRDYFPHMRYISVVILLRILVWIFLQDIYDLATASPSVISDDDDEIWEDCFGGL